MPNDLPLCRYAQPKAQPLYHLRQFIRHTRKFEHKRLAFEAKTEYAIDSRGAIEKARRPLYFVFIGVYDGTESRMSGYRLSSSLEQRESQVTITRIGQVTPWSHDKSRSLRFLRRNHKRFRLRQKMSLQLRKFSPVENRRRCRMARSIHSKGT